MAWRCGSVSRSLISTARASSLRSSAPLPRLRPPMFPAPRLQSRRLSFATPRKEWKRWVMREDFQSSKGGRICRTVLEQAVGSAQRVQQYIGAVIVSRYIMRKLLRLE